MFPLRDSAATRRLTPVNSILIAANIAAFAYEVALGPAAATFVTRWAMVPARIAAALDSNRAAFQGAHSVAHPAVFATIISAMFLHAGIWHLAGNMLYLFIFGAAVESRMGSARYCYFYVLAGIAAALATVWIAPASRVPVLGASGAIAGVLGAHFIFFPRAKILTLVPIVIVLQMIEVPAYLYLLLWFAIQLYSGIEQGGGAAMLGGVAWWAHIGGFMFGVAIAPLISPGHSTVRKRAR